MPQDIEKHSRSAAPDYGNVVAPADTTKKRGRPASDYALSQATRDARYRGKRRFRAAGRALIDLGFSRDDLKQFIDTIWDR